MNEDAFGICMEYVWNMLSESAQDLLGIHVNMLAYAWNMLLEFAQDMHEDAGIVHGMRTEYAWNMHGYAWSMFGICTQHAWTTQRICLEYA